MFKCVGHYVRAQLNACSELNRLLVHVLDNKDFYDNNFILMTCPHIEYTEVH